MNFGRLFLTGALLSLVTMFVIANIFEGGDMNATSMYFVLFFIPVILTALLNSIFILQLSKSRNRSVRIVGSFIPLLILALLTLQGNITLPFLDGNLVFLTIVASIALGLTNILWLIKNYSS